MTCVPDKPIFSDVVLPLLLTVVVLWRAGAFGRERWAPGAEATG